MMVKNVKRFKKSTGIAPIQVAAATGEGVPELKKILYEWKRGLRFLNHNEDEKP